MIRSCPSTERKIDMSIKRTISTAVNGTGYVVTGVARVLLYIIYIPFAVLHFFTGKFYMREVVGTLFWMYIVFRHHIYENCVDFKDAWYTALHNPNGFFNGGSFLMLILCSAALGLFAAMALHFFDHILIGKIYWAARRGLWDNEDAALRYKQKLSESAGEAKRVKKRKSSKAVRDEFMKKLDQDP